MPSPLTTRLNLAVSAAKKAGDFTLQYFMKDNFHVELKSDRSPVTVADRGAETLLRELISEAFPDDAILGEELPSRDGNSGFRWILDPIDGTKSFIHGVPLYGTLIAVEHEGRSVLGVIRVPATGECVYAARGEGAFYTQGESAPVPARVSACEKLEDALVMTSSEKMLHRVGLYGGWRPLMEKCRLARNWGDCYGYMLVATGRAEVMLDPVMNLWDIAALVPIITEAGGTFTDLRGDETYPADNCVATNGKFHREVVEILGVR